MKDVVIRAKDLRKVYRLYAKPSYRFLDMFGMLGGRKQAYTEHAALAGINLEIRRGEKVAFIGRNGAGKSTFLKLVTGAIEPTSGTLEVQGHIHALLQIGTGFHPEFTGRENVYAYLAQLGVSGAAAEQRCAEAIEFSELEEYIDQPVKTYSTGMGVRLMFAASTVISPELLVLDEVLGVGDAYFAHKSYNRIRELCVREGTTLLLVTHDVYSAATLCERIIWIDSGNVLLDGDGPAVVKAYEDSVRQQEERRLRTKKQHALEASRRHGPTTTSILVEFKSVTGRPLPSPLYFSSVRLMYDGHVVAEWPLAVDSFADDTRSHLMQEGGAWGEAMTWEGRPCRPMLNYGTAFHKVTGVFVIDRAISESDLPHLSCAVEFWTDVPPDVSVTLFAGNASRDLGTLPAEHGAWVSHLARPVSEAPVGQGVNLTGVHGTGDIVVSNARFVTSEGEEAFLLAHGQPAELQIDYEIRNPSLREAAQVVVALHREGVQDVCRFITRDLTFDAGRTRSGTVRLSIPRLALTDGRYEVTIMIAREGYYDSHPTVFYSINPDVYCCISRMFEINIAGSGLIGSGTVHIGSGDWSLHD